MENDKSKKSSFKIANIIILALGFITSPLIAVYIFSISAVTEYFIIVLLILFILIPVFYKLYKKKGILRKALWLVRIAFFAVLMILAFLPLILINFEHTTSFYRTKKAVFSNCVCGLFSDECDILPQQLPKDCRDYKLKTQNGVAVRHYYPKAYLMFRTDKDTLKEYEEIFKSNSDFTSSSNNLDEYFHTAYNHGKAETIKYYYPKGIDELAFSFMDEVHREAFISPKNIVMYTENTYKGSGCLIVYDSGLVVFWT